MAEVDCYLADDGEIRLGLWQTYIEVKMGMSKSGMGFAGVERQHVSKLCRYSLRRRDKVIRSTYHDR